MFEHLREFLSRVARQSSFIVGLLLDVVGFVALGVAGTLVIAWPFLLLVLAASLLIAAFQVFQEERRKNESYPCLCDLVDTTPDPRWLRGQPGGPVLGRYLGIKFDNKRQRDLVNARLRLESIEQWLPQSQTWHAPEWFSPLLLVLSFNDGGGDTTTIGVGENRTWDLVCYESEGDTHAKILAAQDALRTPNQIRFGKWRVRCRLAADGCRPCDVEATFDWNATDNLPGRILNFDGPLSNVREDEEPDERGGLFDFAGRFFRRGR